MTLSFSEHSLQMLNILCPPHVRHITGNAGLGSRCASGSIQCRMVDAQGPLAQGPLLRPPASLQLRGWYK